MEYFNYTGNMEYFDYTGQVSCIDRQIAELQARREAVINGYCFTGYIPQPRVEYVEEAKEAVDWKYPSKGELPKESKQYFCKLKAFVGGGTYFDCLNYDTKSGSWENSCDEVLAWKEEIS